MVLTILSIFNPTLPVDIALRILSIAWSNPTHSASLRLGGHLIFGLLCPFCLLLSNLSLLTVFLLCFRLVFVSLLVFWRMNAVVAVVWILNHLLYRLTRLPCARELNIFIFSSLSVRCVVAHPILPMQIFRLLILGSLTTATWSPVFKVSILVRPGFVSIATSLYGYHILSSYRSNSRFNSSFQKFRLHKCKIKEITSASSSTATDNWGRKLASSPTATSIDQGFKIIGRPRIPMRVVRGH